MDKKEIECTLNRNNTNSAAAYSGLHISQVYLRRCLL